jgi:hypothetical protein
VLFRSGRVGSGCAEAEQVGTVELLLDLLPDSQAREAAEGVALQGDARTERRQLGLQLVDVDLDAVFGKQDGGGQSGDAGSGDRDALHCGHGMSSRSFSTAVT